MATQTVIRITDDLDGSDAHETVRFALDGAQYEIDLSEKNAKKLRDALNPWAKVARKTGGRRGRRDGKASGKQDLASIRDWARKQGMNVSDRGRVSAEVRRAYDKAH